MTEGESKKAPKRPRRRHGRFRRWVVRPVFWLLALVVVLAFVGVRLLESEFVQERGRRWVERRLEVALEREVRVEGLALQLLPLTLELRGVEIAGSEPDDPPFVEVGRLLVEARSVRWGRRSLTLGRVLLEDPHVRLVFRADGTRNLPLSGRGGGGGAGLPFELMVGEFTIRDGTLEVEQQRLPLSVAGRNLRANLLGGSSLEASGRVEADEVELVLPRARPYLGSVSLRVSVEPTGLRIVSGRVSGERLQARVGGEWAWRGDKGLNLDFDATAEAELFDQLGYTSGQVSGSFRFIGGLAWQPELWGFRGALTSPLLDVVGRRLADVTAEVAGDRNAVRADISRATYGGGALTGLVEHRFAAEDRPFDLRLRLDRVGLAGLLADQSIPLDGVDGRVSGPFDYSFPIADPRRGSGRADLAIAAGQRIGEALRLSGSAQLLFEDGIMRGNAIRVVSEHQHALVIGVYDMLQSRGQFDLDVGTERVAELLRLLPIAPETLEGAAWAPLVGSGSVGGSIFLSDGAVRSEVRLDLQDVVAPGCQAERVQGTFGVDQEGIRNLRVELLRANGAVIVSGSVPFEDEHRPSPVPFSLSVQAAGWPSADAEAWYPLELPVEGLIGGSLQVSGVSEEFFGRLDAALEPARIAGVAVDRLALDLEFDAVQTRFARVEVESEAGAARLSGVLERETGVVDFEIESGALDLTRAPLAGLVPGLAGRLQLSGSVDGPLDRPLIDGEAVWSGFSLGGGPLDAPARTLFAWDGESVTFSGAVPGVPRVTGGGRLDAEGYALELDVAVDDLVPLLAATGYAPLSEVTGAAAGTLTATGGFEPDDPPLLGLRLDRLDLIHDSVTLRAAEPVELRMSSGVLEVDSIFLTTEDQENELFAAGRVELDGTGTLDLTAQGSLRSEWFELLFPELQLKGGRFDVLASIGGTVERPQLNGVGRLEGASVLLDAISTSLDRLGGVVLFYPDRIVLDSFRARVSGGVIEAGGSIVLAGGDREAGYQVDLVATDLSLSYPEGWLLRGDARATLISTEAGRALRGEVELDRAYYLEPVKVGIESAFQALTERRRITVAETSELLATTSLSLNIRGADALRIRNNLADLGGDLDFSLRGTLADPVLFGAVELSPGGTLVYAGNDYEIERGELNFANPYRIEPIVDLVATTDLRDYDVRLTLTGSPDRLDVGVSSDPPLPEIEVLALLTGGRASGRNELDRRDGSDSALAVEGFLAGEAASVVTDRVNRLFGLDRLRLSPLTGASGDLSSARVTLGERISRDLFATYSYDPSTTEEQILELEWSVSPSLVVVATQNGDGSYSLDLRWERAF